MDNVRTFSEFHHRTGIARNILSDRLQKLTAYGILIRTATPSGRRHEYQLSDRGHDLFPVILTLRQWGEQYVFTADESYSILVDEYNIPIPKFQPRDAEGNPIYAGNTHIAEVVCKTLI